MKTSRGKNSDNTSTLTLRLWNFTGTGVVNLIVFILLLVYFSPMSYMVSTALKSSSQMQDSNAPIWPAKKMTYDYKGKMLDVYQVPTKEGTRNLALVTGKVKYSDFIDPSHPENGLIRWNGFYHALHKAYTPEVTFNNFVNLVKTINYPRVLRNTLAVVVLGGLGVLFSSIVVAYGLSRFKIPGGKWLLILLIATIMIPDSILLIPNFVIYTRVLGWGGSFLPLIVPQLFGSAVYIFLLYQNFKSIPREMDEAAMLDGAGPLRTLIYIIIPQSVPVITTVSLLFIFNTWNELRMSSLYLSTRIDLQPISFTAQAFQYIGFTAEVQQAATLLVLVVPILLLFLAQRFFMRDMIVTGLEK
jgi:multiple sugar transport system permease protein